MGFQPRARSRRFGRPVAKKKPARDKRDETRGSLLYVEHDQINASQLLSATANALEHLGNQRFALPPYSEHFQRWMENIATLLSDFESKVPEIVSEQYRENVDKVISNLKAALKERTDAETMISNRLSDVQLQITRYENELAKLDQDYKSRNHEVRRHHEQSFERLRAEIKTLDGERLRIIHTKPTLLQKLFRHSEDKLNETTNVLRSKKNAFDDRKQLLKEDLKTHRLKYENERRQISEKLLAQRAQLEESKVSKLDDALETRRAACEELRGQIIRAVDSLPKLQDSRITEAKS